MIALFLPAKIYAGVTVINDSTSQSTTDVKIENNGEVKTFHTEGNQSVNWTSDDGKSKVVINNDSNNNSDKATVNVNEGDKNNTGTTPQASPRAGKVSVNTPIPSLTPTPTPTPAVKKVDTVNTNFLEIFLERINGIFKNLFGSILKNK